jgi:hypothetical protein
LSRVWSYQTAVLDLEIDAQAAAFGKRLGEDRREAAYLEHISVLPCAQLNELVPTKSELWKQTVFVGLRPSEPDQ